MLEQRKWWTMRNYDNANHLLETQFFFFSFIVHSFKFHSYRFTLIWQMALLHQPYHWGVFSFFLFKLIYTCNGTRDTHTFPFLTHLTISNSLRSFGFHTFNDQICQFLRNKWKPNPNWKHLSVPMTIQNFPITISICFNSDYDVEWKNVSSFSWKYMPWIFYRNGKREEMSLKEKNFRN